MKTEVTKLENEIRSIAKGIASGKFHGLSDLEERILQMKMKANQIIKMGDVNE
jgi:hypothetical protein